MEPLFGFAAAVVIAIAAAFVLSDGRGTPKTSSPGGGIPNGRAAPNPDPRREGRAPGATRPAEAARAQVARSAPGLLPASTPVDPVPEMTSFTLDLDLSTTRLDRFVVEIPESDERGETDIAATKAA